MTVPSGPLLRPTRLTGPLRPTDLPRPTMTRTTSTAVGPCSGLEAVEAWRRYAAHDLKTTEGGAGSENGLGPEGVAVARRRPRLQRTRQSWSLLDGPRPKHALPPRTWTGCHASTEDALPCAGPAPVVIMCGKGGLACVGKHGGRSAHAPARRAVPRRWGTAPRRWGLWRPGAGGSRLRA